MTAADLTAPAYVVIPGDVLDAIAAAADRPVVELGDGHYTALLPLADGTALRLVSEQPRPECRHAARFDGRCVLCGAES